MEKDLLNEEVWKPVVGFEGLYLVSSLGNVKSLPRKIKMPHGGYYWSKEHILKPHTMPNGYLVVGLYDNGSIRRFYVHRLVAYAFLGENKNLTVNHKDENKLNNNILNLEYMTIAENIRYSAKRAKKKNKLMKTTHNAICVNQYTLNGTFVARYESASKAAQQVGLKRHLTIIMCCRRERNMAAGYLWRFDCDTDLSYNPIMRQRKVVQLDINGNFIARFNSIKEASSNTKSNIGHICSCCNGKQKTANGYKWMYEENYNNL